MDGYYTWMLVATALVLMMTTPALALFYGGMTRSRSVLSMMMMSYVAMGVVGLTYVLWGWSMSFGPEDLAGGLFANPLSLFGLDGVDPGDYVTVCFQLAFAVLTAALISGALADRVRLRSWVVFLPLWATLVYFPLAHMVWGGGFLADHLAAQDYAGGTVVHINAGVAGGVLAVLVGRRIGFGREPMRPHNLPLTMLGAGLLWFGWYGFNVGSIVLDTSAADGGLAQYLSETGTTFLTTTVATMAAMLAWLLTEHLRGGHATSLGAASGIVTGLVAITPACGAVGVGGAIVIGAVAGAACAVAVGWKGRLGLDDSLDVVGVHLVGGLVGTLMIGLVSTSAAPGGVDGLFHGGGLGPLGAQAGAAGLTILWSGVVTAAIGLAIRRTVGWRVEADSEVGGIDLTLYGESGYDLHARPARGSGDDTGPGAGGVGDGGADDGDGAREERPEPVPAAGGATTDSEGVLV